MKKWLLLLLVVGLKLSAQPTFNNADLFTIGYTYQSKYVDPNGVDTSIRGANAVWDFSNLQEIDPEFYLLQHYTFIAPTGQPGSDRFPLANMCRLEEIPGVNSPLFTYYRVGTFACSYLGEYRNEDFFSQESITDIIRFPFTFGSEFMQSISGTRYGGVMTDAWDGNENVTCIGYGTLMLPQGIFEHVLLLYTTRTYTRISSMEGAPYSVTSEMKETVFEWISAQSKGIPLLSFKRQDKDNSFDLLDVKMNTSSALSITNPGSIGFNIWPNPARDQLYIQLPETAGKGVNVTVYSVTGQKQFTFNAGKSENGYFGVPVDGLPPGTYLLRLDDINTTETRRFVVMK